MGDEAGPPGVFVGGRLGDIFDGLGPAIADGESEGRGGVRGWRDPLSITGGR
jgi:hypothetical protein